MEKVHMFVMKNANVCEHPSNALHSNAITDDGISTFSSDEHPWNAKGPIIVTDDGTIIWVRDAHWKKAHGPIVIDEGILTFDSDVHL